MTITLIILFAALVAFGWLIYKRGLEDAWAAVVLFAASVWAAIEVLADKF